MSATTTEHPTARPSFWSAAGKKIVSVLVVMMESSRMARCAEEASKLFALSDEELARKGIRREEIIQRSFGPYMHL